MPKDTVEQTLVRISLEKDVPYTGTAPIKKYDITAVLHETKSVEDILEILSTVNDLLIGQGMRLSGSVDLRTEY